MNNALDPSLASIDGMIDWLKRRRVDHPTASLRELLGARRLESDRLIDIACIDLIQRRRMGHAVGVEQYLADFPQLSSSTMKLDLIDAELCVAHELGNSVDPQQYISRFPDLADAIRELIQMDNESLATSVPIGLVESRDQSQDSTSPHREDSFELDAQVVAASSVTPEYPVELPDWFQGQQCVASSPGRWLIRGRDAERGTQLALKMVQLPQLTTASQESEILDACEAAARVRNRFWVNPSVATIQNSHLAIVRPWIHARVFAANSSQGHELEQVRQLAVTAFAIQAAHESGATHGGLHSQNVLIGHQGEVHLVDSLCSREGLDHWLNGTAKQQQGDESSDHQRIQWDTQSLIKLIVATSVQWQQSWAVELPQQLRQLKQQFPHEACGRIGDCLIRLADGHQRPDASHHSSAAAQAVGRPWRDRLMRWLPRS